ncbi:MAG: DUF4331 family protein [Nocardioides sp.]
MDEHKYGKDRADLNAILLTGIPSGIVPGFQNYTGPVESDMLRLNLAIKPTAKPNDLGLVFGDAQGFPNGRRVNDDVVTIELRVIAGLTIPLVDPSFKPTRRPVPARTALRPRRTRGAPTSSPTSTCLVAVTRPSRARPRPRDAGEPREPPCRAGRCPARHRG